METKKFKDISLSKYSDQLLFAEHAKNLHVDLQMAREMVSNRIEFTDNKPHYVVIDLSNVKEVTPEAREYMQQQEGGLKNILGAAFFADNLPAELLAKVYVKTPTRFPSGFFQNKEEALSWIHELMKRDFVNQGDS
jgi:hypothetical protein